MDDYDDEDAGDPRGRRAPETEERLYSRVSYAHVPCASCPDADAAAPGAPGAPGAPEASEFLITVERAGGSMFTSHPGCEQYQGCFHIQLGGFTASRGLPGLHSALKAWKRNWCADAPGTIVVTDFTLSETKYGESLAASLSSPFFVLLPERGVLAPPLPHQGFVIRKGAGAGIRPRGA